MMGDAKICALYDLGFNWDTPFQVDFYNFLALYSHIIMIHILSILQEWRNIQFQIL